MLYPLKFTPILISKIWGGQEIRKWYAPLSDAMDNVGESWLIASCAGQISVVENGPLAGNELPELLEVYMNDLVGDSVYEQFGNDFPLLIKCIDADADLSVQVHPNDEQAEHMGDGPLGKTEMWYVMRGSKPDATVIAGWNTSMSAVKVREALSEGRIIDQMHVCPVKEGDVVQIPSGLVHAIRKGTIVAEIQESSDLTYRLYDYDRRDAEGNLRPLHLDKALAVLQYDETPHPVVSTQDDVIAQNAASTPYFTTNVLDFGTTIQRDYAPLDSFVIYLCVDGDAEVEALEVEDASGKVTLRQGEAVLLPAVLNDIQLRPLSDKARLLEVYIA